MKLLLIVCTFVFVALVAARARAQVAQRVVPVAPAGAPLPERVEPLSLRAMPQGPTGTVTIKSPSNELPADRPTPRVKLSYIRHGIGDGTGGAIPMNALHLDLYPLSWRWLRAGIELEAGRGRGTILGNGAALNYGLVGVNLGLRVPRRISPFVEGRLAAGIINTRPDGAVMIPGTPLSVSGGGSSFIHTRGVDLGVEVYTFGRNYVSAAIGWQRTTWQMNDFDTHDALVTKSVSHDSFLLKVGIGF
jgi:hypothetical protein